AERSRGLFRRAKAMASGSANVAGWISRVPGGPESARSAVGDLTTVSAGSTFRSDGIRTCAATPAGVTSGGMGKVECRVVQAGTRSRKGIRTRTDPRICATTAAKVVAPGKATCTIGSPLRGRTGPDYNEVRAVAVTLVIQMTRYFLHYRHNR